MTIDVVVSEQSSDSTFVKWKVEIDAYEKRMRDWESKCKKIIERYEDNRSGVAENRQSRFNALWSNIQTILPSLYARLPNPEIDRRNKDSDDVGRVASDVLQRCVKFCIETQFSHDKFRKSVLDYLLCGRGTIWARYAPKIATKQSEEEGTDPVESLEWEDAILDYVHWRDFGHSDAKSWEEVDAVWRAAYLSRKQLIERFGEEKGEQIPLNWSKRKEDEQSAGTSTNLISNKSDKAVIYELWSKEDQKAYWLCKDFPELLDEIDDPLKLNGFFPCPKPLYATLTNEKLEPIPDYTQYQDQAIEIDDLTSRMSSITKSIKVAGCYDASAQGITRLLNEGQENVLIPIDSWALFNEKGGLKGAIELLPMNEVAEILDKLDARRQRVKSDMYEIMGISDLVRGDTNADETATAQGIKDKYLSVRFRDRRNEVNRFIRDSIQLIAEIVAEHFNPETIIEMSALKLFLTEDQKQQTQQQLEQAQQIPTEEMQSMIDNPTWDKVCALLKNNNSRSFRIDIETDSVVLSDEAAEKNDRLEFLKATSDFIQKTFTAAQQSPQLAPLLGQLLLFGIRSFKTGRLIEGDFENAIEELKKQAANPPAPQPNPELLKSQQENQFRMQELESQSSFKMQELEKTSQLKVQEIMADLQAEREKNQMQMELKKNEQIYQAMQTSQEIKQDSQRDIINSNNEMQIERERSFIDQQNKATDQKFKEMELQISILKSMIEAKTKIEVAEISAKSDLQLSQIQAAQTAVSLNQNNQEEIPEKEVSETIEVI